MRSSKCRHCIAAVWLIAILVNMPALFVFTLHPYNIHGNLQVRMRLRPSGHAYSISYLCL